MLASIFIYAPLSMCVSTIMHHVNKSLTNIVSKWYVGSVEGVGCTCSFEFIFCTSGTYTDITNRRIPDDHALIVVVFPGPHCMQTINLPTGMQHNLVYSEVHICTIIIIILVHRPS